MGFSYHEKKIIAEKLGEIDDAINSFDQDKKNPFARRESLKLKLYRKKILKDLAKARINIEIAGSE